MEQIIKKIKHKNYDEIVFKYALCGFYVVSKEVSDDYIIITFNRDLKGDELNKKIVRAKRYYKYNIPSIIPIIITIALALIFLTLFIVFALANKEEGIQLTYILSFLLPGIVFFLIDATLTFYRTKKIDEYIKEGQTKQENIKKEVLEEIKNNALN